MTTAKTFRKSVRRYRTDFLFPRGGIGVGAGSVFNLGGRYFTWNRSSTGIRADFRALVSDWGVIGDDLNESAESVADESVALGR